MQDAQELSSRFTLSQWVPPTLVAMKWLVGDRPGLILCQNVFEFGGTWLVVEPSGAAVR